VTDGHDIASFMAENLRDFKPFAYFDKHLDCIRVKIQDCRSVEVRLNRFLTILKSYNKDGSSTNVGFTIKGIAHLFSELGLDREGIFKIVDILNKILQKYPDYAVRSVYEEFTQKPQIADIQVDLRRAA